MTNNPTIDGVSRERELFEKFTLDRADRFHPDFSRRGLHPEAEYQNPGTQGDWEIWQGRALLDAPVVERQPVAPFYISAEDWNLLVRGDVEIAPVRVSRTRRSIFTESLFAHPPEVAALQSTIAQLQARVNELGDTLRQFYDLNESDYAVRGGMSSRWMPLMSRAKACLDATAALNGVMLPTTEQFKDAFRATGYVTNDQAWDLAEAAEACLDATAALNGVKK